MNRLFSFFFLAVFISAITNYSSFSQTTRTWVGADVTAEGVVGGRLELKIPEYFEK